jgi:hypothetical protein
MAQYTELTPIGKLVNKIVDDLLTLDGCFPHTDLATRRWIGTGMLYGMVMMLEDSQWSASILDEFCRTSDQYFGREDGMTIEEFKLMAQELRLANPRGAVD